MKVTTIKKITKTYTVKKKRELEYFRIYLLNTNESTTGGTNIKHRK
jgi:hypothetical protein